MKNKNQKYAMMRNQFPYHLCEFLVAVEPRKKFEEIYEFVLIIIKCASELTKKTCKAFDFS